VCGLIAAIRALPIASPILIGAIALRRLAIPIAHVLLVTILVSAGHPMLTLLIFVSFLIGHGTLLAP
jgi:hypothetical protein